MCDGGARLPDSRAGRCAPRRRGPPGRRCPATNISATAVTAATPAAPGVERHRVAVSTPATRWSSSTSALKTGRETRILPTNVVCVYAPRFAEVRVSHRHQRKRRHPDHQDRQIAHEVCPGRRSSPNGKVWFKTSRPSSPAPWARRGPQGPAARDGRLEQPRGERLQQPALGGQNHQSQTAEVARTRQKAGAGQAEGPPGRHQVGRGAGRDRHRRGRQPGRQGVGPARR